MLARECKSRGVARTADPVDFGELFVQKLLGESPITLSVAGMWESSDKVRVARQWGQGFELCGGLHLPPNGHNPGPVTGVGGPLFFRPASRERLYPGV